MKQLETPIGIYIGSEIKIYYKTIGDGTEQTLVMSLQFNADDSFGDDFVKLFSAEEFSTDKIIAYLEDRRAKEVFGHNVEQLVEDVTSDAFKSQLAELIADHYKATGYTSEEINEAIARLDITFTRHGDNIAEREIIESKCAMQQISRPRVAHPGARRHNGVVQRYAFGLIKQIIEKNSTLSYQQLHDIFGGKRFIKNINDVNDEDRWFLCEDEVFQSIDGTKIVVSADWGLNGRSKPKMDKLRAIAARYGIDTTLP